MTDLLVSALKHRVFFSLLGAEMWFLRARNRQQYLKNSDMQTIHGLPEYGSPD